jgi:hypothetical protein
VPSRIVKALINAEQFLKENNDEAFNIRYAAIAFETSAFKIL